MKRKRKRKLYFYLTLTCCTCVFAIVLCAQCLAYRSLDLIDIPIANRNLMPREVIELEDIEIIQMPKSYLVNDVLIEENEVVGKYTSIQGMIPAGSCFYKNMIFDRSEMPDYPHTLLKKNQASYTLETDLKKLGGTLVSNQRVDVHVSLNKNDVQDVHGILFENVRIIAIKDHQGNDLEDKNSTGMPHIVILAINRDDLPLLTRAEAQGDIRLFASDETYQQQEARVVKDSSIYQMLSL